MSAREGDIHYERLVSPHWQIKLFSPRCSLWLAPDHMLMIRHLMFLERYRRFYFDDIQSIIVCRTSLHAALFFPLTLLVGILVLIVGVQAAQDQWIGVTIAGILMGLTLALLLCHVLLGPTCKCQIRTGVQSEFIPALTRLRAANRVRQILIDRIEARQGRLVGHEDEGNPDIGPNAHAGPSEMSR